MALQFRPLLESDAARTLEWRSSPRVARFMRTDLPIDLERQKRWIRGLASRTDSIQWIIQLDGEPIGVAGLTEIDLDNLTCASTLYIGDEDRLQLGGLIPAYLANFAFFKTPIEGMNAEVLEGNNSSLAMCRLFGYRETGLLPGGVIKGGVPHDVHMLELTKTDWLNRKVYHRFVADMPIPGPVEEALQRRSATGPRRRLAPCSDAIPEP